MNVHTTAWAGTAQSISVTSSRNQENQAPYHPSRSHFKPNTRDQDLTDGAFPGYRPGRRNECWLSWARSPPEAGEGFQSS
jgi:hypothetical protein